MRDVRLTQYTSQLGCRNEHSARAKQKMQIIFGSLYEHIFGYWSSSLELR